MKQKNLAVELLKKLIAEQGQVYHRTNVVKSEKFSEIIQTPHQTETYPVS